MSKDEMREAIVTLRETWPKARWSTAQVQSMEIICDLLESLVDDLGSASVIREKRGVNLMPERDSDPDVRDLPGGKVQVVNPLPIIDEGEGYLDG